jgi:membrane-anchored protein YejM (alkaline phosphatase superfamily)
MKQLRRDSRNLALLWLGWFAIPLFLAAAIGGYNKWLEVTGRSAGTSYLFEVHAGNRGLSVFEGGLLLLLVWCIPPAVLTVLLHWFRRAA